MHYLTKGSEKLQKLREEPQASIEIPQATKNGGLRDLVFKIQVNNRGSGNTKTWEGGSDVTNVYYLYGDERRAVRKFIKENSDFVSDCFKDEQSSDPIRFSLPEQMHQLMQEEYEIMKYNDEI